MVRPLIVACVIFGIIIFCLGISAQKNEKYVDLFAGISIGLFVAVSTICAIGVIYGD